MGLVRANKAVFLGEYGYRKEGEEFNYEGLDNEHLVSVETGPYQGYSDPELRAEISRRGLVYVAVATSKMLQAVLLEDDAKTGIAKVEPQPIKPTKPSRAATAAKTEDAQDGSGSEKYGASDWTQAGRAKDGFPVDKGSAEDVS